MHIYNVKIVETPETIEVWRYSEPILTGKRGSSKRRRNFNDLKGYEKVESIRKRIQYYKNKRVEISRLIDCNFDKRTCFLTLTQNTHSPIKDSIDIGNYEFDKFIRRLKSYLKSHYPEDELKYIATWERTKRGWIHYHIILFSFPFIPAKVIEQIWSHGFIKINQIDHVQRSQKGLYISKYFTKELDSKEIKKKAYFKSRNLKKPEVYKTYISDQDFDIKYFGIPEKQNQYLRLSPSEQGEINYYKILKS